MSNPFVTRIIDVGVIALLGFSVGCDGKAPTAPLAVAPSAAIATPPPTFTLSGFVTTESKTGPVPAAGVVVRATLAGRGSTTDSKGFYSIPGLPAVDTPLVASKWGYEVLTKTIRIGGDTTLNLLVERFPTYTLSGVISELTPAGQVPIADVLVYCDWCGEDGHTFLQTDAEGHYSFPEVYAWSGTILFKKDGYQDPPGVQPPTVLGWLTRTIAVTGDTRFDIQLVRR